MIFTTEVPIINIQSCQLFTSVDRIALSFLVTFSSAGIGSPSGSEVEKDDVFEKVKPGENEVSIFVNIETRTRNRRD